MLAWRGGKQRLVQLAHRKQAAEAGHRGVGGIGCDDDGGRSAGNVGGGVASTTDLQLPEPLPTAQAAAPAARGIKHCSTEGGEGEAAAAEAAAGSAQSAVGAERQLEQEGRQARLKRVKGVPRSLDLLALRMPDTWGPAAAAGGRSDCRGE